MLEEVDTVADCISGGVKQAEMHTCELYAMPGARI